MRAVGILGALTLALGWGAVSAWAADTRGSTYSSHSAIVEHATVATPPELAQAKEAITEVGAQAGEKLRPGGTSPSGPPLMGAAPPTGLVGTVSGPGEHIGGSGGGGPNIVGLGNDPNRLGDVTGRGKSHIGGQDPGGTSLVQVHANLEAIGGAAPPGDEPGATTNLRFRLGGTDVKAPPTAGLTTAANGISAVAAAGNAIGGTGRDITSPAGLESTGHTPGGIAHNPAHLGGADRNLNYPAAVR